MGCRDLARPLGGRVHYVCSVDDGPRSSEDQSRFGCAELSEWTDSKVVNHHPKWPSTDPTHCCPPRYPQAWQLRPAYLGEHGATLTAHLVVPVSRPTSFADVKRLEWFTNHPFTRNKGEGI